MTTPINDLLGFVDGYVKETEGMTISEASSMTEMALQELAAEVRRLSVPRPMEEAPNEQVLIKFDTGRYNQLNGFQWKYNVHAVGWLPLPTPASAEG